MTLREIDELLAHVQATCKQPRIQVMFVFAAHTGARKSEMLRSQIEDFDFDAGMVTLREKKRDRSKDLTFRSVPATPLFRQTMSSWFTAHPGGELTICEEANVPIIPNMAHHYFRWTVERSKWERMWGWHVLRHSFCSNCALKGINQRIIDSWMGHQSEDMRRRNRHLFPDHQQQAMKMVFGSISEAAVG